MEDATISQEPLMKDRFPSVVDTDDLVFELGKQAVKRMNLEKLLNGLLKKVKTLEEAEAKLAPLKESNNLYQETNRKLDAELVKIRQEVMGLKNDIAARDEIINDLKKPKKQTYKKRK